MDDAFEREVMGGRQDDLANRRPLRRNASQFFQKSGPGSFVNNPVQPTTTAHHRVGSIDDVLDV